MNNKQFNLYLYRHAKKARYTIGKLYRSIELPNGELAYIYICDTLEDKDRGLNQTLPLSTNKKLKIYGETAIPMGEYSLGLHNWSKYSITVPILKNVPAFEGILIHNGTNEKNTEGCILVGENKVVGKLVNGTKWMHIVTDLVRNTMKMYMYQHIIVTDIPPKNIITESGEKAIKKKSV